MGHKTNAIGFRLGLITFWRDVFVTCINKYKQVFQKARIIKEICKNYFTNYSVPEFLVGTLRNDKTIEQKDRKPLKFRSYYLMFLKDLLQLLFVLCIAFIPKLFGLKMLTALILQEQCQKHNQILNRRNLFSFRYLFDYASNSAIDTVSFVGLHIRNMSATLLKKYILRKLSQYFTIQEILKPIVFDLKRSPLLYGFRIIVAGRVTRKECAAFLIKNMKNLPLNKKVAAIDYAAGAKIQKFGMVGIKVFLYIKNKRTSFYRYNFNNNTVNFVLILIVSGLLEDTAKKVAKPSWYLMLRKTKAISHKKVPNPEYDNRQPQPDEVIIEEKLSTMLNQDGTLKDTVYDSSKPLPRLSATDNSGCNHMLVCKNIENITRKAEYLVIGNLTSSGVAYILNKNGVEVGVRHIGELVHIYSPNNEQRMQYFWAFQTPMIASAKDLYKLKKESQTLAEYPHIRSHFNSHYTHWRKRGILSEYKKQNKNSNSDKDNELKGNNTNSAKRNNI